MTLHRLWINACPVCHHDIARPLRLPGADPAASYFAVSCNPGLDGCGHTGPVATGEGASIDAWNSTTTLHWEKEMAE